MSLATTPQRETFIILYVLEHKESLSQRDFGGCGEEWGGWFGWRSFNGQERT